MCEGRYEKRQGRHRPKRPRSALAAERSVLYIGALLAGANSYELALTAFSAVTPMVSYGCAVPSALVMWLYLRWL